jgi:2-methylcitrate dehydratase
MLAEKLAAYADSLSYSDIPRQARNEAKRRVIDSLGLAIGAFDAKPVKIVRSIAEEHPSAHGATVIGTRTRSATPLAAFTNGVAVRYLDYMDYYASKNDFPHPCENIPPLLAVAEVTGASGKDLITSIVLAYELQCRLADAAPIRPRGWDNALGGLVSVPLAAGKLLGLPREQLAEALNISLNAHIPMRQVRAGELSMWKACSFAESARNALFSAMLASRGMTGPSPIFEGKFGFFKQISGKRFDFDTSRFGGRRGGFKILDTSMKYYPAEMHAQSAVTAALNIRPHVRAKEIASVLIDTQEPGFNILGREREKWNPKTRETADHSLPFIVSAALLRGRVDNDTYSPRVFRSPKILKFMKKVRVRENPRYSRMYPEALPNKVTARLRSGAFVAAFVKHPKGHPRNPMGDDEVEEKFKSLTKGRLWKSKQEKALRFCWKLEKQKKVSKVFKLLKVKK